MENLMSDDGRIEYIKDSLDKLHEKVDVIYKDSDLRLKALETNQAHQKGFARAMSIVSGLIGSGITLVSSYLIFHKD